MTQPLQPKDKTYIGDGLYAEIDNAGDLILTAEDGLFVRDRVVLEPQILRHLLFWLKPLVVIQVDGGRVSTIYSDMAARYVVQDFDLDSGPTPGEVRFPNQQVALQTEPASEPLHKLEEHPDLAEEIPEDNWQERNEP